MSISLTDGGTSSTAGGSAQSFDRTSTPVNNGYEYADVSETNHLARQKVIITARNPSLQNDGSWSKHKAKGQFVLPITLADGSVSYCVARAEIEYHPEASAANVAELREMGAQVFISSAFDAVFQAGTLPA
jgi:hypothetical protein